MKIQLALTLAALSMGMDSRAEHMVGGSIDYRCLGGNFYEVTLTIYRDCSGFDVIPQQLKFINDCGVDFTISNLQVQETEQVAPLCPAEMGNSICDGGAQAGMQKHVFRHTLFLSPCPGWKIYWSVCCRPFTLNLVGLPGLYIEAQLDNTDGGCNDSPYFADHPPPFVCSGQLMGYDPHVVEAEGDSLVFSLADARYAAPNPEVILYQPPWYGAIPFSDLTIDPLTGRISFLPSLQGFVTVVVLVEEYGPGGQFKGSAMRDFMFTVMPCDNTIPTLSAGIIQSLSGDGLTTGERSAAVCAGGSGCMDMSFTDADASQSLQVTSNAHLVLPGAEWSVSGTNPVLFTLCWDSLPVPPGIKHFAVKVLDDKCPLGGLQTYTYTLDIQAPPELEGGSALACGLTPEFFLGDSMAQLPPPGGNWSGPGGMPHSGWFQPDTDPPGAYTYSISTSAGCTSSAVVTVTMIPVEDPLCEFLSTPALAATNPKVFPNPTTGVVFLTGYPPGGNNTVIALQNAQGALVWTHRPNATDDIIRLELPGHLGNGSYIMHFEHDAGRMRPVSILLMR